MLAMFRGAKQAFERMSGCRIYRNSMPHGVDCYFDLGRRLGRDGVKVVFDVGANVGQSALTYLGEFPRAEIYSFEPVGTTYQELVAKTRQFHRIHPYHLGMGREAGEAVINVSPYSTASSMVASRPEDHAETIAIETIAGFVEKHSLQAIDFLKIDTEGYEPEVLAGAAPLLQQQRIHFIFAECEPVARTKDHVSFVEMAEFMGKFGYRVFGVYEQQPEWDGRNALLYWNVLFVCEKLVARDAKLP